MGIVRIEEAHYGVEDLELCIRFFADFGLGAPDQKERTASYRTAAGQLLCLHDRREPELPPAPEPGSTIREVVWGVDRQSDLDVLVAGLGRDREITEDPAGTFHTHDDCGYGIGLRLVRDSAAQLWFREANSTGHERRWNEPLQRLGRARPYRMCHVAYHIPLAGREQSVTFYTERLGFHVTDQLVDMGTFMRAAGDADQHTLLLGHRADRRGINHIAFEVANFDEVVEGGNHMVACGWPESRRLGRHTIGSNVFRFFQAPCGGRVEYAADMDRVDETYGPHVYQQRPPHHMWMLTTNGQKEEL